MPCWFAGGAGRTYGHLGVSSDVARPARERSTALVTGTPSLTAPPTPDWVGDATRATVLSMTFPFLQDMANLSASPVTENSVGILLWNIGFLERIDDRLCPGTTVHPDGWWSMPAWTPSELKVWGGVVLGADEIVR